jgi:O-antigen ligase
MKSSAIWEASWALLSIILTYLLASGAKRTIATGVLLLLIPFQFVDTRYATSSVLMAYALGAILLLKGDLKFRLMPELACIVFAYAASTALAGRQMLTWQVVYVFQFVSCLVVFLLAYDYARLVEHERSVANLLLGMNVLIGAYCLLQIWAGPGAQFIPFGIEEFAFNSNRDVSDPRLVGPFGTPGNTAGYLTLMTFLCTAELIPASGRRRLFLQGLIVVNLLGLVATGNRAGMLVLIAMFPLMLIAFRRELGARRVVLYTVGGIVVLAIASVVAINYTRFGSMLERLQSVTETSNGVPQTRAQTWPIAMEKIRRSPWFGEGPYFMTQEEAENMGMMRNELDESGQTDTRYDPYPHSLYLYLLRTVGIVGLTAVMLFFVRAWLSLRRSAARQTANGTASPLVRAGMIVIPAFLIAQITLEFNRAVSMDYAQFIFALVGLLVGLGDRLSVSSRASAASPQRSALGNAFRDEESAAALPRQTRGG